MKLLSEREQVRTVAKRWRDSYPDPELRLRDGRIVGEIAARLDALDPETATAEDGSGSVPATANRSVGMMLERSRSL